MSFKDWVETLPKVKYSELSEYEKMAVAMYSCQALYEDMPYGQFKSRMNSNWYGTLLRLLSEIGYDTEPIKDIDWNDFGKNADYCRQITLELYHKISDSGHKRDLMCAVMIEQIIMDK